MCGRDAGLTRRARPRCHCPRPPPPRSRSYPGEGGKGWRGLGPQTRMQLVSACSGCDHSRRAAGLARTMALCCSRNMSRKPRRWMNSKCERFPGQRYTVAGATSTYVVSCAVPASQGGGAKLKARTQARSQSAQARGGSAANESSLRGTCSSGSRRSARQSIRWEERGKQVCAGAHLGSAGSRRCSCTAAGSAGRRCSQGPSARGARTCDTAKKQGGPAQRPALRPTCRPCRDACQASRLPMGPQDTPSSLPHLPPATLLPNQVPSQHAALTSLPPSPRIFTKSPISVWSTVVKRARVPSWNLTGGEPGSSAAAATQTQTPCVLEAWFGGGQEVRPAVV
jgi:hypothetical protein